MIEHNYFDDFIRNFMVFIEPGAQTVENFKIPEMSKNFKFFRNIAECTIS